MGFAELGWDAWVTIGVVVAVLLLLLFLLLVTANRRGERVGWKGRSDKQRISRLTAGADPGREEP